MHIDRSERIYIIATTLMLVIFASALFISSFAFGIQVPVPEGRIDAQTVATPGASIFADPVEDRIRELAPGKYEIYMLAQMWKFSPGSTNYGEPPITVPVNSTVTFYVTSKDIQHGFLLEGTNLNMMIIPGQISKLTATFDEPGTFNLICHEYCGAAHQTMYAQVIVEEN